MPFDNLFDNLRSEFFFIKNLVNYELHIASSNAGFIYMPSIEIIVFLVQPQINKLKKLTILLNLFSNTI